MNTTLDKSNATIGDMTDSDFKKLIDELSDEFPPGFVGLDRAQKEAEQTGINVDTQVNKGMKDIEGDLVRRKTQIGRNSDYFNPSANIEVENLPDLNAFEQDLYLAVRDQVQKIMQSQDTWGALNKRYSNTPILKKGQVLWGQDDPEAIPHIQVYLDASSSFSKEDFKQELLTLAAIQEFVDRGEITLEVYYFANRIGKTPENLGDGTSALRPIIENIQATGPTNLIIMTDADLTRYSWRPEKPIVVEGLVWYVWKAERSEELTKLISGRQGTMQYKLV